MKNFIKYGAVGLIGYLVGFYEMKCKVMKLMLEAQCEKDKNPRKRKRLSNGLLFLFRIREIYRPYYERKRMREIIR